MKKFITLSLFAAIAISMSGARIVHIPMEASSAGTLKELVGGTALNFYGKHKPENMPGAVGIALRLDGFSSYAAGKIPAGNATGSALTVSMWVAPETYPIIELDTPTEKKIRMAGTLDESNASGWAFNIGYTGKYSFTFSTGGWVTELNASDIIPCYEWSHLVAVIDCNAKTAKLYRNGVKVGEIKSMTYVNNSAQQITIGKDVGASFCGPFMINTFNGLIDEIEVFDTALPESDFANAKAENHADLSIPASRFANDKLRPKFHGMPAAAWTNESHGMTYADGKYHVFFQKNANGAYMTRLHWGHISSPNLYDWTEEKIAIAPDQSYDVKGCWSGCVFSDDVITGGKPNIIYTGVDYAKAVIAQAIPTDDALINWDKKSNNPIINGRPSGLSDDFRDPYFFRNGDDAYIIVGTSKDGVGACTLHKYNKAAGSWSNDGKIFFKGSNIQEHGSFWEMPNITKMENGKWLFTTTPQATGTGVLCLYWTGSINSDGTFSPDGGCKKVELASRDGYALLSPTIYQHDGKTIALGIVPDKIGGNENYQLGWAHCYSLPREWSLDANGNLLQKPFSGLSGMRSSTAFSNSDFSLSGSLPLGDVQGRNIEILANFTVGNSPFGFRFFKGNGGEATLTYNPSAGSITVDFSSLQRWVNDGGSYNGVYILPLPEKPAVGQDMKINLFIDGSIVDIFVNDKYAQSIRVFPTAADADGVEMFADAPTQVKSFKAWKLISASGINEICNGSGSHDISDYVNVYDMQGRLLKRNVLASEATEGLESGIYAIGGKKIAVRN